MQQEGPRQRRPLGLGLPSLHNCKQCISALHKLPHLGHSVTATRKGIVWSLTLNAQLVSGHQHSDLLPDLPDWTLNPLLFSIHTEPPSVVSSAGQCLPTLRYYLSSFSWLHQAGEGGLLVHLGSSASLSPAFLSVPPVWLRDSCKILQAQVSPRVTLPPRPGIQTTALPLPQRVRKKEELDQEHHLPSDKSPIPDSN